MNRTTLTAVALLFVSGLVVAGCNKPDDSSKPTDTTPTEEGPPAAAGGLPETLMVPVAPPDPKPIGELRASAKEGDTVVFFGEIGGDLVPFVEGRASMMVVDGTDIYSCEEMPDDSCETPWDFCCEDPKKVRAVAATVQVVGEDGRPLKADLKGWKGLKEQDDVIIVGTVGPRPDPAVFVVNATAIYVKR
ncbi:MAG: hypothetical protein ACYTDX_00140 [Planctomycetota bacterium]|jgi:hypothetical protein